MKGKLVVVLLSSLLLGAAPPQTRKEIRIQDFSKDYVLVGALFHPLGEHMTLEGDYFGPPAMTKSGLYVDAILGMKFSDPPVIIHLDDGQPGIRLEKGKRYRLRGYETGRYSGEARVQMNWKLEDVK